MNTKVASYITGQDADLALKNVKRWRSYPGTIEYRGDVYHRISEAEAVGIEMVYLAFCRYCGVREIKNFDAYGVAAAAVADGKVPLPLVEAALLTGLLNHGTISSIKVHCYGQLGEEARAYLNDYSSMGSYLDALCHKSPSPWDEA